MSDIENINNRKSIKEQRISNLNAGSVRVLEEVLALIEKGDEKEVHTYLEIETKKVQDRIAEIRDSINDRKHGEIDRSSIPDGGDILTHDDTIHLRMVCGRDRENYLEVSGDCSPMKSFFEDDDFKDDLWREFLKNYVIAASVYSNNPVNFIGYCSIKDIRKDPWEIAIELKKEYQHQGYGFHALCLFISKLKELTGNTIFRVRIDADNIPSQKLFKKLGAYPDGVSEYLLHGDDLKEFQMENRALITDELRMTAEEFCMEPEEILGYVLEYRIDASTNPLFNQ